MLKLATFLLLGLLSVCGQLISSQENLTITAPIDTSRNSFLILTNEENLFSLTKNSSLASTSNATSNSTSNETSSSSSLGNAYRVDAFFQELFGPSGFVEVEIVDWFSVNASNVILKKVYKLRLRSIIEFEDTGAAGFDSETPLQVFKLNSSWTFWRGPNKLSNGVWTWDATSNNSAFGLLGVANTSSQIPFTTSFPRNGVNVSALSEGPIRVLNVSSGSVFDFDFSSVSSSGNETSGNATSGSNATSTSGSLNADMTSALNSLNNFPKTGTENVLTVPAIFWVNDLNVSNLFTSNSSRLALQMQLSYFEFVIVNSSSGSVFEISIPANVSAKSILDRFGDLPATILGSNGSVPLIISNFTSIHLPSNARPARNDTSYIFYATINSTSHAGIYHNFTMLRGYNLAELTGASNASSNTSGSRQPILINDDAPSDLEAQFETAAPISDISSEFNRLPMEAFINLPSGGSLIANFTVFLDNSTVCWVVTWSDLPEFTSIGVYGPAEPSVFGPLIFEITNSSVSQNATSGNSTSSPSSGGASPSGTARDCKTLTFAQLNGIVDGLWYVLIKTPQAPAQPELFRGQILPAEASKSS